MKRQKERKRQVQKQRPKARQRPKQRQLLQRKCLKNQLHSAMTMRFHLGKRRIWRLKRTPTLQGTGMELTALERECWEWMMSRQSCMQRSSVMMPLRFFDKRKPLKTQKSKRDCSTVGPCNLVLQPKGAWAEHCGMKKSVLKPQASKAKSGYSDFIWPQLTTATYTQAKLPASKSQMWLQLYLTWPQLTIATHTHNSQASSFKEPDVATLTCTQPTKATNTPKANLGWTHKLKEEKVNTTHCPVWS